MIYGKDLQMKRLAILLILILSLSLVSCKKDTPKGQCVSVYCLKESTEEYMIREISCDNLNTRERIQLVFDELMNDENGQYKGPLADVNDSFTWEIKQGILSIGGLYHTVFDPALSRTADFLRKAAIVKSLFSIDEVNEIHIIDKDKDGLLKRYISYDRYSFLTEEDIHSGSSFDGQLMYRAKLYFPNMLTMDYEYETRVIPYDITKPLYETVVEALQQGPESEEHDPCLPTGVKIHNIYVDHGICYITIDESIEEVTKHIPGELVAMSIISTLGEINGIDAVCIELSDPFDYSLNDFDITSHIYYYEDDFAQ